MLINFFLIHFEKGSSPTNPSTTFTTTTTTSKISTQNDSNSTMSSSQMSTSAIKSTIVIETASTIDKASYTTSTPNFNISNFLFYTNKNSAIKKNYYFFFLLGQNCQIDYENSFKSSNTYFDL